MLLIVIGCIVPMLALCSALRISLNRSGESAPSSDTGDPRPQTLGRWEGLAEEMTRRGDRVRPRCSDAATRARHLAAVLPADARR